jgi:hypothetical protein
MMSNDDSIPGYGYLYVFLGCVLLAGLFLFFPALILHGRAPGGAWTWTTGCTIAEACWAGFLLLVAGWAVLARANSPHVRAMERAQHPWVPQVPQPLRPDLRLIYMTQFLEPPDVPVSVHRGGIDGS